MRLLFSGMLLGMAIGVSGAVFVIRRMVWAPEDPRLSFIVASLFFLSAVVGGLELRRRKR